MANMITNQQIVAIYKDTLKDDYYDAAPWSAIATFKFQDYKVRAYMRDEKHRYKITIKIDGKRKKPIIISASKMLHCTQGNWVYHDGKYYIFLETIQMFLDEFARTFVINYFNLPFQMPLPLYRAETEADDDIFGHPTLTEIL